ncbi:polysaccharide biosynthesis protein [Aquimarina aggregata]|uniref:Polysaccharide biosynthesis protein n=1 Tax=Aquimarina aggregata TaxID=1642818 RepID=A0A162ZDJ3_9FLAO|nr:oligosaccharide flippase family protein [Aquimarina aggregata]KZS39729.1 polysaccharide biosynthesis protein [Aquimarina aggregata]
MSVLKGFLKDTVIYGFATVFPRIINFLLVKVHTDTLERNEYATNTDFYIWASLFAVLLTFGMETTFFRFYNKEINKNKLISTGFLSTLFITIIFALTLFTFFDFFLKIFNFKDNPLRLKLFIGILVFDTLAMIPFAYLRAINKPFKYTIIKIINVLTIVSINLVFLKYIPDYIEQGKILPPIVQITFDDENLVNYIFIANIIGSIISFLLLIPYLSNFKLEFDFKLLRKMLLYSWPIVIAGIAYIINENLDKFLIKRLIGDEEMGIYSACYKLSIFMNLYIMAFRLGAEPFFFNQAKKKNAKEVYSKVMTYFVIIGAVMFLGIVVYIDFFKLFINSDYWEALAIVPIVLLANLFLGIYHNISIWYKLTDRTYFGMYFSIFGAFLTIVLNLVLIPKIGFMACAWITLFTYVAMTLISYFYGRKYFKIPYNLFKIGMYLTTSILFSLVSFIYFKENYWVSSIILLLFIGFIILNEKKELNNLLR